MNKKRFTSPYQFIWRDEDNMIHICQFLSCDDGCSCEKSSMSFEFLNKFIKKYKQKFTTTDKETSK